MFLLGLHWKKIKRKKNTLDWIFSLSSPFFPFPCVLWTFPLLGYISRLVTEASPNSHKFLSARCLPCLIWIVNVSCWYWIYRSVEEFLRLLCSMVSVKAPVHILLPIFDYVSWLFYHESANQDVIFLSFPGSTDFWFDISSSNQPHN